MGQGHKVVMKGRRLEDLHGGTFIAGDYQISGSFPEHVFQGRRILRLTRDTISNTTFILVDYLDEPDKFAYVFYENTVYVYGELSKIEYNQKSDIRHGKG